MDISGGVSDSEGIDLLLPVGHVQYRHSVFSVTLSLCRAVGAVAFQSRIPEVTAVPILSSTFCRMILMVQSIHRLRAGRWLRVLSEIGVGNLMFAIRVRKSVAPLKMHRSGTSLSGIRWERLHCWYSIHAVVGERLHFRLVGKSLPMQLHMSVL